MRAPIILVFLAVIAPLTALGFAAGLVYHGWRAGPAGVKGFFKAFMSNAVLWLPGTKT